VLFPPGDADALAQELRRLASDPELRDELGKAAREKAKEFAPEVIAGQVMRVYRSVLRAGAPG
jgi:glycosyltransferase involved in cell wall biosynthesis